MNEPNHQHAYGWAPSVYYAESLVNCPLQKAWEIMLDYKAWNPDFVNAEVTLASGKPCTAGEVNLIKLFDANRAPLAEFYAETAKLVPPRHIVWYVYPKEGASFRNFVDFWLAERLPAVKFSICYYAQNQLSGEALTQQRRGMEASLHNLAVAFKNYCEGKARSAP